MSQKIWKYLALGLVAGNLVYWFIVAPALNWKTMVERELIAIGQILTKVHPELMRSEPQRQQQPSPPAKDE